VSLAGTLPVTGDHAALPRTDKEIREQEIVTGFIEMQLQNFGIAAVCGSSREKARTYILTRETHDREYYCGFLGEWNLAGQLPPNPDLNVIPESLADNPSVAVLSETLSNLSGRRFNTCIDNALSAMEEEEPFAPDLLITLRGGRSFPSGSKPF